MKHPHKTPLAVFSALALLTTPLMAAVVAMPYTDTFQTTSVGSDPADWVESNGAWVIANNGTSNVYQGSTAATSAFASQLQFSNLGASAADFTVSTSFKITTPTTSVANEYIGLSALNAALNIGGVYYLADVNGSGTMRIISANGANTGFTAGSGTFGSFLNTTSTYTMTLAGSYVGSTLNLSFTVSNGITSQTILASDTSPLTGSVFGLRLNNASSGDTLAVQFNNYTVVPEPGTVALLGLGFAGLVLKRRRQA